MSILTKKIEDRALVTRARSEKMNRGIAHAATVLHESKLGARCPNLVKSLESDSREAKYQAATMVQLMENTAEYVASQPEYAGRNLLMEDATSAVSLLNPGVASLTPKVVDIVNVFYPMMVANYIADIQALDRQSGQIFVIKTRYSNDAAGVKAGDIVFEQATDGTYSSEFIGYGAVKAAATVTAAPSSELPADATVKVRAGSFIVRLAGKEIARDYGNGAAKENGVNEGEYVVIGRGVTGTVNAQTGEASLKLDGAMFAEAIEEGMELSFEAAFDTETDTGLIRKIQFDIPNQPVLAKEHPLMSSYSVAAGLVMNAHLAVDTDELIANQIAGTIRWERDLTLIKMVHEAAKAVPSLTFDCSANGANLTLQQRYSSYSTVISSARGYIQEVAGRGTVEFIICSATQGLPVIEQIEGFQAAPESKKPIGPYLAGTLRDGTISVIAVPYSKTLPADQVIFGFKGFQLGDSSIVLAEWVPLYFTPTFQAPNLKNHRGALSFYDLFLNKPEYLCKGAIANFNEQ
jgi:hypothetical protein